MIFLASLAVTIGIQATDRDADRALKLALGTAGVITLPNEPGAQPPIHHFYVDGFVETMWRSATIDGFRFLSLPGCEQYFKGGALVAPGSHLPPWADRVAAWTWGAEQPVLSLVQEEGSLERASGRLHLPNPHTAASSLNGTAPRSITSVRSGCPLTYFFGLPAAIGPRGLDLDFAWDLHSPTHQDDPRLTVTTDAGELPSVAIELRESDAPLVVAPSRLPLSSAEVAEVVISTPSNRGARLELIAHPACVDLLDVEREDHGWRAVFRANPPISDWYHVCRLVRIAVLLGNDPRPYERFVAVHHTTPILDESGGLVLRGVFGPGERVKIWLDGHSLRLSYPDRLGCSGDLLRAFGFQPILDFEVTSVQPTVDASFVTPVGGLRVLGVVSNTVVIAGESWDKLCAR